MMNGQENKEISPVRVKGLWWEGFVKKIGSEFGVE